MSTHPPPAPSRWRLLRMALLAGLVLALGGAGLVVVVHADWTPPAAVKPYDPLPRW